VNDKYLLSEGQESKTNLALSTKDASSERTMSIFDGDILGIIGNPKKTNEKLTL
jgi:hypothetical protein